MVRFRARSEGSDRRADLTMVMQVIEAVERALNASKPERDVLGGRVSDALSSPKFFIEERYKGLIRLAISTAGRSTYWTRFGLKPKSLNVAS
jgi:hypothetical protein